MLKRAAGSNDDFAIVVEANASAPGDQDRLTFTVDVSYLGSEFTLGATEASPTAVGLHNLSAGSGNPLGHTPDTLLAVLGGLLALALASGGLALARRRD